MISQMVIPPVSRNYFHTVSLTELSPQISLSPHREATQVAIHMGYVKEHNNILYHSKVQLFTEVKDT